MQQKLLLLIHYTGDESVAVNFPHGISKGNQDYICTLSFSFEKLQASPDLPGNVFKDKIASCGSVTHLSMSARNTRQVKNSQQRETKIRSDSLCFVQLTKSGI